MDKSDGTAERRLQFPRLRSMEQLARLPVATVLHFASGRSNRHMTSRRCGGIGTLVEPGCPESPTLRAHAGR